MVHLGIVEAVGADRVTLFKQATQSTLPPASISSFPEWISPWKDLERFKKKAPKKSERETGDAGDA